MENLVRQLKEEHNDIIDTLMRVKVLKVCSDDGQRVLMNAKDMLLEHLRKEDEDLYPMLRRAAAGDDSLAEKLKEFDDDMAKVSRHAFEFFEKYSADTADVDGPKATPSFCERLKKLLRRDEVSPESEFLRDFESLYDTLMERVRKEENIIYTAYDRVVAR
jgi:hemerythrin-like domain-containing protein